MSKDGREIWFECYVNDEQMVEKEPKVKEHLDSAEENISIFQVSSMRESKGVNSQVEKPKHKK